MDGMGWGNLSLSVSVATSYSSGGKAWVSLKYIHRQFCLAQLVIFRHNQAIEIGTLSYKKGHSFSQDLWICRYSFSH